MARLKDDKVINFRDLEGRSYSRPCQMMHPLGNLYMGGRRTTCGMERDFSATKIGANMRGTWSMASLTAAEY